MAKNAGPIGGRKQTSEYKINCRFNKELLVKKIKKIGNLAPKVTVLPFNWERTVSHVLRNYKQNKCFFYFDPPFYRKADKLYRHFFDDEPKHLALSKKLKKLKHKWVLSYDRAPEIREMYLPFIQKNFAFPYSINSPTRRIEKEYLITSNTLKRPTKQFLTK